LHRLRHGAQAVEKVRSQSRAEKDAGVLSRRIGHGFGRIDELRANQSVRRQPKGRDLGDAVEASGRHLGDRPQVLRAQRAAQAALFARLAPRANAVLALRDGVIAECDGGVI
jgi:hypothetical protein